MISMGMGEQNLQRIFYFHVPVAWVAFLAMGIVFVGSIVYLSRRDMKWDALAHASAEVKRWLVGHTKRPQLFFLPGYSPDLNPDEYLNQDVKTNAVGRTRPSTPTELLGNVRSYLRSTQARPSLVKRYFHPEPVRYALV